MPRKRHFHSMGKSGGHGQSPARTGPGSAPPAGSPRPEPGPGQPRPPADFPGSRGLQGPDPAPAKGRGDPGVRTPVGRFCSRRGRKPATA